MSSQRRIRPPLVALAVLLLIRSRLLTGPRDFLKKLGAPGFREALTQEDLDSAQQQLYEDNTDGSRTLLVPHRGKISRVRYPTPSLVCSEEVHTGSRNPVQFGSLNLAPYLWTSGYLSGRKSALSSVLAAEYPLTH